MNTRTIVTLSTLLLLISGLSAGRQRKEVSPADKSALAGVPFTELQKICNGLVTENFGGWFPEWIVQYLMNNRYVGPTPLTGKLQGNVQTHIASLRSYLDLFEKQAALLEKYPRLYLKIEVRDLLAKISGTFQGKYETIYDNEGVVHNLQKEYSPLIDQLIHSLAQSPLDLPTIAKIGKMFKDEHLADKNAGNANVKADIEDLKDEIIDMLYEILDIYTELDDGPRYKELDAEEKVMVQEFYDTFSYLLDPKEVREFVFEKLIGKDKKGGSYTGPFFGQKVFDNLGQIESNFRPLFKHDGFVMVYNPQFRLTSLHEAAQPSYFSWDFPNVFEGVTEADLALDGKKDSSPSAKKQRKIAKLHLMLYKVYTFARSDGTLKVEDGPEPIPALRKLYKWVLNTKDFDAPELDQEGNRKTPSKGYEIIFRPDKFKRNFLPLLQLICSKIPDCTMDLTKTPDRSAILAKYKSYGNYEELKSKPNLQSVLEPTLIAQLEAELAKDEFKAFSDEVDSLIDENPVISNPTKEEPIPQGKIVTPGKKALVKITAPKNEKLQEDFNGRIGKRFLPVDGSKPTEQQEAHFKSFIDGIEATENPTKKATLRTLLIRFIYSTSRTNPNAIQPLVEKTIPYLSDKLRHAYSIKSTAGLRNFMMMTLNKDAPIPYSSKTPEEALFHTLDFIYFVEFASEDYYNAVATGVVKIPENEKAPLKQRTLETRDIVRSQFLAYKKVPNQFRIDVHRRFITKDPLFIEKIPSMEFFIYFLDFFDYYSKISSDPKAVYVNYNGVFINFYSFAARVRNQVLSEVEQPYQFMLDHLERCMDLTEKLQHWVDADKTDSVCNMSHRKYAEMYFFYKVYLIATEKPFKAGLADRAGNNFNTHTRIFLLFASEVAEFGSTMNKFCGEQSYVSKEPLCVSWRIYNDIITYLRNSDQAIGYLTEQFKKIGDFDSVDNRVNMINGLEASYLNTQNSNMIDWEKANFLFDSIQLGGDNLYQKLAFKKQDIDGLTNYLKRTYSKLIVDPHETTLAKTVQNIMNSKGRGHGSDALLDFLMVGDQFVPLYLKLFLQFSVNDDQFRRIAELLIDNDISYDLIRLNDVKNDNFFMSLAKAVQGKDEPTAIKNLHDELNLKYEKLQLVCKAVTAKSFEKSATTESEFDPFAELLEDYSNEEEVKKQEQEQNFQEKILPAIVKETKSILIEGLSDVKKETAIVLTSQLDHQVHLKMAEVALVDDDSVSLLSFEDGFDSFRDDFSMDNEKDHSLVNGVPVDEEKLSLVHSLSNSIIMKLKEKVAALGGEAQDEKQTNEHDSSPRSRSKSKERQGAMVEGVIGALIKKQAPGYTGPVTRSMARKSKMSIVDIVKGNVKTELRSQSVRDNERGRGGREEQVETRTNRFGHVNKLAL